MTTSSTSPALRLGQSSATAPEEDLDDAPTSEPTSETSDTSETTTDRATGPTSTYGVLLVVAAAAGFLAAMMLTIDRIRLLENPDTVLACNISPFVACGPVMQSRAGALFGFPNPLLGIGGFAALAAVGAGLLAGARYARWHRIALQVGVLAAATFITWLQTQSLYVIGALCLWCILVWTVTIPVVVATTVTNLRLGTFGPRLQRVGQAVAGWQVVITVLWYLVVLCAIALRFYRDFALLWFGVAL